MITCLMIKRTLHFRAAGLGHLSHHALCWSSEGSQQTVLHDWLRIDRRRGLSSGSSESYLHGDRGGWRQRNGIKCLLQWVHPLGHITKGLRWALSSHYLCLSHWSVSVSYCRSHHLCQSASVSAPSSSPPLTTSPPVSVILAPVFSNIAFSEMSSLLLFHVKLSC